MPFEALTPEERTRQANDRAQANAILGRMLYSPNDPRHPDMDFGESIDRRLLARCGITGADQDALIERYKAADETRRTVNAAIARNAEAIAAFLTDTLECLPEGVTLTVEPG